MLMTSGSPHPQWQLRTEQILGGEALDRLRHSRVLVAGMGGVGSMAAEMICRSGIGSMSIIDGDIVQPGNINRQLPAFHSSLGRPKTEVMTERLLDINPSLELTVYHEFIRDERIPGILAEPYDYVVDAIDTLSPKIYFIYHSIRLGHSLVSSMGSGGKLDPERVRVADFSETYNCRLAYILRKKLRKMGVHGGFRVVFSTEQVDPRVVIPVEDEPNKKSTVGTVSYIPAIFGCTLASIVIRELAGSSSGG